MHKRFLNELTLEFTIKPDGPILIKAGDRGGVDPTRPDMEFVRAWHDGVETVYLPGSSLKGMVRAHCEKIARTVSNGQHQADNQRAHMARRLSCNPLLAKSDHEEGGCGEKLTKLWKARELTATDAMRYSCFVCQLYGNTALASHVRLTDAYPADDTARLANRTEERHGVAIDRVYGSVAVGPFQFETVTQGSFSGTLTVRNFTTAQLGLLGLAIRDLQMQRVSIGFAKSRGMGRINFAVDRATVRYPMGQFLAPMNAGQLAGAGAILRNLEPGAAESYGYPAEDAVQVTGLDLEPDEWGGLQATLSSEALTSLWRASVPAWGKVVTDGR